MAALRALPADRIVAGKDPIVFDGFGPVIDSRVLSTDVVEAFRAGAQAQVPMLIGSNALEFPMPPEEADKSLSFLPPAGRAMLQSVYPSEAAFKRDALSDILFGAPAHGLAALHAKAGAPTYLYRFSVLTPSTRYSAAPHASDIPYVFRNLGTWEWKHDANDAVRAAEISAYWVAFAKTGDPNGEGRPVWPRYAAQDDVLLNFTNAGPMAQPTPNAVQLNAIMLGR